MLIQKEIESKIVSAISTALTSAELTGVDVSGSWETAQQGLVKWIEDAGTASPVFVSVSVAGPAWRAYSLDDADLSATIAVFTRTELDPTGNVLVTVVDTLESLVRSFVRDISSETDTLDATSFSVDAVSTSGSSAPAIRDGVCNVAINLTISGSYRDTSNN